MEQLINILGKMPVGVHYGFSDWVLYPLIYYVVRYRRKLVHKNLSDCFPEKTPGEIRRIEKQFYHHFADLVVEAVYGYGLSDQAMREHVRFHNHNLVKRLAEEHGSVIVMLAHLGNWEWFTDYNRQYLVQDGLLQGNVYRKQTNKQMNKLMYILRSKHGGILIDKTTILRQMLILRKEGKKMVYGLICDQKPRPEVTRYWTEFLHHETGFLDGGEVLGKKFDYPVLYAHVSSPKRGYYEVSFETITEQPKETAENEITRVYAERLEKNIREQPEQWLWTHNRWKWGKPSK